MVRRHGWSGAARSICSSVVAALVLTATSLHAEPLIPLDDFSPAFLGKYRKVMEIEEEIRRHAVAYGVDFDLARAVCLYESGGNAGLASHAGAQGYFQVMPRTYRELRVTTNIEAGVKYLAQMVRQFGREDRAIAAYNGGPGRVGRAGGIPLETLQYVIGVGHYRTVLKQHDESLRQHASRLKLVSVRAGDDWSTLSERLQIQEWELRVHNPFLSGRRLRAGELIAYPPEPRQDLFTPAAQGAEYRVRHGDNYIELAVTLGLEIEALRAENGLWQLQSVPAGVILRVPLSIDRAGVVKAALSGREPGSSAPVQLALANVPPANDDNAAPAPAARLSRPIVVDSVARASATPAAIAIHRVRSGDTLSNIARQYGTTVSAIQQANKLRRTTIQVGQTLRIPRGQRPEA